MNCELESGIDQCLYSVSGVRSLFICNSDEISNIGVDAYDRITGMTAANFFELKFTNQFADAKESTQNTFNGWVSNQTIDFSVAYDEGLKRFWLEQLKHSRVKVIVESQNGNLFLFGQENGMKMQEIGSGIGIGGGSFNGFRWNLQGSEKVQAREIEIPIATIRTYIATSTTTVSNCGAYSGTTWGSTSVTFFQIQNCLFSDFT